MCAPCKITNDRLFSKDNPMAIRDNLRLKNDYIGVNARVWWLFMHVHGGGPVICREELNIYSAECQPEVELRLEELQGSGNKEFARRISRQFVDDCQGDVALYEKRYGSSVGDEGAVPGSDVEMSDPDCALRATGCEAEVMMGMTDVDTPTTQTRSGT